MEKYLIVKYAEIWIIGNIINMWHECDCWMDELNDHIPLDKILRSSLIIVGVAKNVSTNEFVFYAEETPDTNNCNPSTDQSLKLEWDLQYNTNLYPKEQTTTPRTGNPTPTLTREHKGRKSLERN